MLVLVFVPCFNLFSHEKLFLHLYLFLLPDWNLIYRLINIFKASSWRATLIRSCLARVLGATCNKNFSFLPLHRKTRLLESIVLNNHRYSRLPNVRDEVY